jgi:hypothetical protein
MVEQVPVRRVVERPYAGVQEVGPAQVGRHAPELGLLRAGEVALALPAAEGDHERAVVDATDDAGEFMGAFPRRGCG